MAYAGIDLGGTYVKAGLLEPGGASASAVRRWSTPYVYSGRVPEAVDVGALMAWVSTELSRLADAGATAVFITNQMHGVILTDDNVVPHSAAYTWQADLAANDPGGTLDALARLSDGLGEETRRALGNELRQGLPIVTLACLARRSEFSMRGLTALSLGDFIASRLCGKIVATHVTNAAASGLYDLVKGGWSAHALRVAGIADLSMPEVVTAPRIEGSTTIDGRVLTVACAIGDQQAALMGASLEHSELSVNIATGCQVSRRICAPDTTAPQLRPFVNGDYISTVTHIPAGRALNAFVRLLSGSANSDSLSANWAALEQAAAATTTDLRANVALFPAARGYPGSLTGLSEHEMEPGAIFRAAMEDVVSRIGDAASAIGMSGLTRVVLSGGVAYNSSLMRSLVSEKLTMPTRVVSEDADALIGLGKIAKLIPGM